uniref:Uncharacterized protein n=1 Tax=Rhizophora mucronata TaxID=61149 RepID=A0A2P2NDP5_RHIMU
MIITEQNPLTFSFNRALQEKGDGRREIPF